MALARLADSQIRNNRIAATGSAGLFLTSACGNELIGNDLQGSAGGVGAVFDVPTGANIFVGNQNVVIDNGGGLDCDGDGVGDPNIITAPGRVLRGVPFSPPPGVATGSSSRLQ